MLSRVFFHYYGVIRGVHDRYQCYQGCTTCINVIRGAQLYQCYHGCTTFINVIRSIQQTLSMLLGVYNLYQCYQEVDEHARVTPLASDLPSGIKIVTWYIQSLRSKLDQIRLTLSNTNEAAVIGFTETWLTINDAKKDIEISVYKIAACRDRPHNRWGGVAMYIHNDITYKEREDLQHKHIKVTWIEITYSNAKPILVGTVYRPHDSLVEWYNDFKWTNIPLYVTVNYLEN